MNIGRSLRTARFLTWEQWAFRASCRARFWFGQHFPDAYAGFMGRRARALPMPRASAPRLAVVARCLSDLQSPLWKAQADDIRLGRFRCLGRTVDFGSVDQVDWRATMGPRDDHFWRMTLSYFGWAVPLLESGRPEDLSLVKSMLDSLDRQNGWSRPGVFRDVWHPYAASHRLINLLSGLALYRESGGSLDCSDAAALARHARFCASFVASNLERDLQFNHLLKNLVSLAVYRAALDHPCEDLRFLDRAVAKSVRQCILTDGGHAERSPMYHLLGLFDLRLLEICGYEGPPVGSAHCAMTQALLAMSHTDGDIALFNDSWLGEAPPAQNLVDCAKEGTVFLPATGYARLAGKGDSVVLDCGPCGPDANPAHAHADFLSIEATISGARLIVDTGVATYSAGPLRDFCRSAAQHNGPYLTGLEPLELWGAFRVGRRGSAHSIQDVELARVAPLSAAGRQTGYARHGVDLIRWVGLWPGQALLTVDCWRGSIGGRAALRFVISGDWTPAAGHFLHDGRRVEYRLLKGDRFVLSETEWWPRFGEPLPAHSLAVHPTYEPGYAFAAVLWRWDARFALEQTDVETVVAALRRVRSLRGSSGRTPPLGALNRSGLRLTSWLPCFAS